VTSGSTLQRGRGEARTDAQTVTREPAFAFLARSGLAARGIVYGVIGILAFEVAIGVGGKTASQQGAMESIAREPLGKVLLIVVAVGLAGYAIWRLFTALIGSGNPEERKAHRRVAAFASGVIYASLCYTAIRIVVGAGASSPSSNPKHETAGVLGWPGGPEIVAIAGGILVGVAIGQAYMGLSRTFVDDSDTSSMSEPVQHGFAALGVFGYLARAAVFALIAYGAVKAAVDYTPHSAIGLDGALAKLEHASYGPLLLGIVAVGLAGFALFSFVEARYRKI
jgi:hypothetical protein